MSYRVDIPTLSANEVYTLTFEYEGTETIQLIVGDLTLETTDRRVVFTTTSPVNYIESNMNLTNLNIYEGYYESDDFGGEYTQESYIEGMSLVNLCEIKFIGDTSSWKYQMTGYDEEGYMHIIPRLSGYSNYYKVYPKDQPWRTKYGTYTLVIDFTSTLPNKTVDTCWESLSNAGNSQQKYKDFTYNGGQSRKYVVTFITSETQSYYMELNLGDLDLTTNTSGEVLVSYMVVEGDYFDEFCKEEKTKSWVGIGCVKSPKIVSRNEDGTEESIITTPDDLELYKVNDTIYDKLDLTTGTLYKNTGTYVLDETFVDRTSNWEVSIHDTTGNVTFTSRQHKYLRDEHNFPYSLYNNAIVSNADPASNIVNNNNIEITRPRLYFDVYSNNNYTVIIMPASYNVTTLEELRTWLQNNPMIFNYKLGTPYTEQLSLNPLKSYRNGSITTSSQQLAPTLKTTLPISNKFTTTNLTSGSTYNVYFDGTATKLDAGGTIITNPISPCEVECGGTTLTIEGTDIQNVRVLETSVKNEVNTSGTDDVKLSKIITSEYENIVYDNIWIKNTTAGGASLVIDNDNKTIFSKGSGSWAYSETKIGIYPKGVSLVHIECDIEMKDGQRAYIKFGNGVSTTQYNFRDLKLNNDTATICQGNSSGIGSTFASFVTKGHFSNLLYVTPSTTDKPINLYILTSNSMDGLVCNATNCAEGSIDGYTICGADGVTISNIKIRVVKNYPDDTTFAQHPSLIRQGTGQVIWQDMNMSMPQTISDLEQPIKLRSLGTTYDSYNPVTGELTKRIGVSETDGSYSVLSSPIIENIIMGKPANLISANLPITIDSTKYKDFYFNAQQGTEYTIEFDIGVVGKETECGICCDGTVTGVNWITNGKKSYTLGTNKMVITTDTTHPIFFFRIRGENTVVNTLKIVKGNYENSDIPTYTQTPPHLYTNGQVKVYSESDVYPTTILNGQSTNNYEINELNTSNNYTIRYEGECESINLANKSNTQGTNRIVKSGTNGSGNLTFVNDNGDIDNVLLVQNDVREQEINHFTGLQTVEISKMIVQSPISKHLFYNHGLNDFVPRVNTNYSFDENNNLILSNGYGNNVDTMLQTVDKYTLEKGDSVIFRVVGIENFAADHRLLVKLATQNFAFGGYYPDSYVNFKAPKVQEIINEQGYCDVVYTYNSETTTDNIQISNYFGKWIISSVVLCKQSQEIITPTIIDLPQPVQLNSLLDGTHDTYNPITGEYIQNVGYLKASDATIGYGSNTTTHIFTIGNDTITNPPILTSSWATYLESNVLPRVYNETTFGITQSNLYWYLGMCIPKTMYPIKEDALQWVLDNVIILYKAKEPIITQLTPITIPTFENGTLQLITTDGKVFPMIEYSMPTNNRYDTTSWETGAVYTQRNMTEAYFNESTTPMTPTETMTLTTDHISGGSIILNDNGNGLIVLKGNYTGRDIPYFTGMRSVEAIEVETTPNPDDQPIFGKGGRK